MKKYTEAELKEILKKHDLWRREKEGGDHANLKSANLESANLESANLYRANLYRANLESANLESANLYRANLYRANLYRANLKNANLESANLESANLKSANLVGANLKNANLKSANLESANLESANLYRANLVGANLENAKILYKNCPEEGSFIAFKSVAYKENSIKKRAILKLKIGAKVKRISTISSRKCRAEKAEIVSVLDLEGKIIRKKIELYSIHNNSFSYKKGETIVADSFNDDPRIECSNGIHFFISFDDAKHWAESN